MVSSILKYIYSLSLFLSITYYNYSLATATLTTPPLSPTTVRAVGLGGWLVTEGWITPWLFDDIPNNDLLDGNKIQFKSVAENTYLSAENIDGAVVVAVPSSTEASDWETFKVWRVTNSMFHLKAANNKFIGIDSHCGYQLAATKTSPSTEEMFEIVRSSNNPNLIRIRAPNGLFLQVRGNGSVTADYYSRGIMKEDDDDDPSLLLMNVVYTMRGDFQLANGYGREMATKVLRKHWKSFIGEDDFKFLSRSGINAVRIPVGYWIAYDNPPWPFVGGSLSALDNAFTWALKHGIKIIIDMHSAPGAQSKFPHSGTRDGSYEWGKTPETITQTLEVLDFLANRYANKSNFLALGLLNEPSAAPGVTHNVLEKFYLAGYNTVRKYSSKCYVIMSNRLGNANSTEFFDLAGGLDGGVIDVHYYQIYFDIFMNMTTVQEHMAYLYNQAAVELYDLTHYTDGPLIFIGEWTGEWELHRGTAEEYKKFAAAQVDVYSEATFGWAFWTYKNRENHWSFEWMVNNGYISLQTNYNSNLWSNY